MSTYWNDEEASSYSIMLSKEWGESLALRAFSLRLINLTLSGKIGKGSASVKDHGTNIFGERIPALFMTPRRLDASIAGPATFTSFDLQYLQRLEEVSNLDDAAILREIDAHRLDNRNDEMSAEALTHAFLPANYVDHIYPLEIQVLSQLEDGKERLHEILGADVVCLEYKGTALEMAKATADACRRHPNLRAVIWMGHGVIAWGDTAKESFEVLDAIIMRIREYIEGTVSTVYRGTISPEILRNAERKSEQIAPILRGALAKVSGDADRPYQRVIMKKSTASEVLAPLHFTVDNGNSQLISCIPNEIRDVPVCPLILTIPDSDDPIAIRECLQRALTEKTTETHPNVILIPNVGIFASGNTDLEACGLLSSAATDVIGNAWARTLGAVTSASKQLMPSDIPKATLPEHRAFGGEVALVTGAGGAIGWGICSVLLQQGWHVAAVDVSQDSLNALISGLAGAAEGRIIGVKMDVTDTSSVVQGFEEIIHTWGGVDLVILNAGIAHISALADMDLEAFQRLERVNIDGTLLVLSEAAKHFKLQGTGGDIVLVSTKNVFAPGAKFGAYSATKAAAHQLARIASLELAENDVRVNMVAPDAVFSGGERKSGLWAAVGPDRMRARGLNESELEEYYRSRNLLKAQITAEHVGRAVLYFATRQTPTTGATIPVDGGLPDATPR